jgi:predicted protein (fragment)
MEQNLLIVDDESEILEWLQEMFLYDYEREIGVYTAKSGVEAIELLKHVKFDVVLTDIHMPQMNGITLFHKIKENWPRCRTVFLTGYENFEDVYQVFRHRDVQYVLKSERDEVIKNAVENAFLDIEKEIWESIRNNWMEQTKENLFRLEIRDRLNGYGSSNVLLKEEKEEEQPLSLKRPVMPFLLRLDVEEEKKTRPEEQETEQILSALIGMIEANIPVKFRKYSYGQEYYCVLLIQPVASDDEDWKSHREVVQGALEYVEEIFKISFHRSFSAVLRESPVEWEELADAVSYLKQLMVMGVGNKREIFLQEESVERNEELPGEETEQEQLLWIPVLKDYLQLGRKEMYFELLEETLGKLYDKSKHDIQAMNVYYSIATTILQFITENHLYQKLAFKMGTYKLMNVELHESWEKAADYLKELSKVIFALLGEKELKITDRALFRVTDYIEKHLGEDLPLKRLAEEGGFNASYLSRLFRQTFGETITDYVLNKRMEKAKTMLSSSEEKIIDISKATGYISAQSFARAFRSYAGMSPIEYRESKKSCP